MPDPTHHRPRVGVPWRTAEEEIARKRDRYEDYLSAVRQAGGEPVEISLCLPADQLREVAESLDAFLLPGSPSDVDPRRYGSARHTLTADPDTRREFTDTKLLDHAFISGKPVLAICYGTQLLNVYLGGNLVQDIPSELHTRLHPKIDHDREEDDPNPFHPARIEIVKPGDDPARHHLAEIAAPFRDPDGAAVALVNSSHHQSILEPARGLRVTAVAPDGVVEAVEWVERSPWIVGVQWHPERMPDDALATALFRTLISQAVAAQSFAGEEK